MKICKYCKSNIEEIKVFCNRKCYLTWLKVSENNPMFGKHRISPFYGKKHSNEAKEKIRNAKLGKKNYKKSEQMKISSFGKNNLFYGRKHSEESKKKMSKSHRGHVAWNKGLTKESDSRVKSSWNKGLTRETDERVNKMHMNNFYHKKFKVKKNKLESYFEDILNKNFPGKWEYRGEGTKPIGYKFPDFIHKNENKIIEVFGDYWHRHDYGNERIKYFKKCGYNTLIVWENDIKNNLDKVLKLVGNF